ncbi:hypothetical protein N9112_00050 [bacterium]|nr:hypothetical protein [bacterium]
MSEPKKNPAPAPAKADDNKKPAPAKAEIKVADEAKVAAPVKAAIAQAKEMPVDVLAKSLKLKDGPFTGVEQIASNWKLEMYQGKLLGTCNQGGGRQFLGTHEEFNKLLRGE